MAELTEGKLLESIKDLEVLPGPIYKCRKCNTEFWVFSEVPKGGYIICDDCGSEKSDN